MNLVRALSIVNPSQSTISDNECDNDYIIIMFYTLPNLDWNNTLIRRWSKFKASQILRKCVILLQIFFLLQKKHIHTENKKIIEQFKNRSIFQHILMG